MAAATAGRPDALHYIVSGFLSNPAKEFLRIFQEKNRPAFRIVVWERPDLTRHALNYPTLLRKYRLSAAEPHLALLHPVHIAYLREVPAYRLSDLITILDGLQPGERNDVLDVVILSVVQPRLRKPVFGNESFAELAVDPIDYPNFRRRLLNIGLDSMLLVTGVVDLCLHLLFSAGDSTQVEERRQRATDLIQHLEHRLERDDVDRNMIEDLLAENRELVRTIESRVTEQYQQYVFFCDRVLRSLMESKPAVIEPPPELIALMQGFMPRV